MMEENEIQNIRDSVLGIQDIIKEYRPKIANPEAINKIERYIFEIRMKTLNGYILGKVRDIEFYSKILFSARKHTKFPDAEFRINGYCSNILKYFNELQQK